MFRKLIQLTQPINQLTQVMLRLVVYSHEVYHLPAESQGVKVVSGVAWLTVAGKDLILRGGDRVLLNTDQVALISALGAQPLMLEVLTAQETQPHIPFSWGRLALR